MQTGDVVTVVTISGEYVGKLNSQKDGAVTIDNPRMVLSNPQDGSMGFAKGIAATGLENPPVATFHNVVFVVPSNDKVAEAHAISTGDKDAPKIATPAEKKIII
tara:strand:- start:1308 stop:1619 length:312 start_codon:yes stop_codon:yes gene_type:complete